MNIHRSGPADEVITQIFDSLSYINANIVFDIGANIGQFGQELRQAGYNGNIVSFEPLSEAHNQLSNSAISDSAWIIHPRVALGDHDGEVEINIANNSVSSSVLPMLGLHSSAAVDSYYVSSETTPLARLDSISEIYLNSESRPFIKIDTQGFEWQVLDGSKETLLRARGVLIEMSLVPLYEKQRLWRDLIDRMEASGLTLWSIHKGFTDPRNGRLLQVDVVFLRLN